MKRPKFCALVLSVFRDYAHHEMRTVDVFKYLNENGNAYKAIGNFYAAMSDLAREGWIVRTAEDKQGVWYALNLNRGKHG